MSLFSLLGVLEISLISNLVALGMFISFHLLRLPDLVVGGSFLFGDTVYTTLIALGWDPYSAALVVTAADALAGLAIGLFNVRPKIMDPLTSIPVVIALYSINLCIMGKPNIPLIAEPTLFTLLQPEWLNDYVFRPLLLALIVVAVRPLLDWFFTTQKDLMICATDSNPRVAHAQGVNTGDMILLGMAISNVLVALTGVLFTQTQDGADISMGIGTIVIDLAAVVVGESILPSRRLILATLVMILGAVIYRSFIALALSSDFISLQAQGLNLVITTLVTVALVIPMMRKRLLGKKGV